MKVRECHESFVREQGSGSDKTMTSFVGLWGALHWEEGAWALCEARYRYTSFPTQICGQSELITFLVFWEGG
jgi:hypothetical protein